MSLQESSFSNLLFLCTGNYYRSRFAEILFNTRAWEAGLSWRALSRGLALDQGRNNVGPISPYVLQELETRAILLTEHLRFPLQVHEHDLMAADLIIALEETEHRALFLERFPRWTDDVEYWHVPDLPRISVTEACTTIEREITRLIARLSSTK
jgi:protein-tyrosine phosphatase